MRTPALLALATALALAGCGGGGSGSGSTSPGGSLPVTQPGSGTQGSSQSQSEDAINATNALGTPAKSLNDFNGAVSVQSLNIRASAKSATGACNNGIEFFAPDKNNDANSTETQDFYDGACTQIARDIVRIYTLNGTSENDARTTKIYAINNATPSAVRNETLQISNATFDQYGYPVAKDGFDRSNVGELDIAGSKTLVSDNELVMEPSVNGTSTFCADAAGYNATGVASLGETFGWQGGVLAGGTRTENSDGSVTWSATHAGSTYKGPVGSLSIGVAPPNTTCPITTPEYSLSGGTAGGQYSLPITATYKQGLLTNLSVTNATLANGDSLTVTTNTSLSPTDSNFITGIVSKGGTQISTSNTNAFGNGTLTVTSSGAQYVITDWHVVK